MSDLDNLHFSSPPPNDEVAFDYIKSPDFRTVFVEGAIGGPTPSGNLHMALYVERPAIPRRVVHNVNSDGSLGSANLAKQVSRNSIVRELSFDLVLTATTAKSLGEWLLHHASKLGEDK